MRGFAMVMTGFVLASAYGIGESSAREVKGVTFPETVTIQGKNCSLVGVGLRKKLVISVYLGGLYMETPATDARAVIESRGAKQVTLHFLYNEVSAEQLTEAWTEGFTANAGPLLTKTAAERQRFMGMFSEPVRKGETIVITYTPAAGTEVVIRGQVKGIIPGDDFMQALFSIWFGPKPPSGDLKNGMLGK